ncbi:MAG TPA: nucleoside phosphorylase [Candidatus Dormibacteraeota bacterium]|jgi:purine-nucleoside phosphorylase|nr:nucleoside phosphorylase [Candidatus Dormibacteraeota bacterium]
MSGMGWPFDHSDALVSPAEASENMRRMLDVPAEEWKLPPVLVATFQRAAHERLLDRAGLDPESPHHPMLPQAGVCESTPVAVNRFGVGAPVAAMALEQAIARGVRRILMVGSAGSLREDLITGTAVLVEGAEREDGTSHHYLPAGERVAADPELSQALAAAAMERGMDLVEGRAWTIDAPYRETMGAIRRHRQAGVSVVEMEAAAIFAVARVRGVAAALLVSVSDELHGTAWRPGFDDPRYLSTLTLAADAAMDCAARSGTG